MPARILVIEDTLTNLDLVTYLLSTAGHTALTARDGSTGVETACREVPDLIICDVHLPRFDGYQVVELLRREESLRHVPLVAVTALAMVGDRDKVLAGGFDGYIAKPINPETFVAQVEAFLPAAQRSAARQVPTREPVAAPAAIAPPAERRGTVLVLDNSSVNRELTESMLRPFHYEVLLAKSVEEALSLARHRHPDVIVSDVHLPTRGGFDFYRTLKSEPELRSIPFVFLSSSVGERERSTAITLGADRFISRPIDPHALLHVIEECLRMRANRRAGAEEPARTPTPPATDARDANGCERGEA